jgi:hypothetical protein
MPTREGGPLSPLLANVLLDEVDRELERRGHRFVRYADDCNVYVKSRRAGERVLQGLRGCFAKLALKVNEAKTAVAAVWGCKFLGYRLYATSAGEVKRAVADQAVHKLRERIRGLTRRTRGRSLEQIAEDLRGYVPGWKAYFRQARSCTGWTNGYATGCAHRRQCKTLVAQQPHGPEPGADNHLLRPPGSPEILLTSTFRTAPCGPACRVVWERSGQR